MRNITVSIDDEVYTQARMWAAQHDTSVSAVVQYMLSTVRTDWRPRAFLAARASDPDVRRPVASPLSIRVDPAIAPAAEPADLHPPPPRKRDLRCETVRL